MTAIAAGNVVVIKPSEVSVNTTKAIVELLPKYLDAAAFQIVCGDARESYFFGEPSQP
jgi:aldehyde dehydrogenase (NAD+)